MRYVLKKAGAMLVTLLLISLLAFLAFDIIPADPVTSMLGTEYTPEKAEALRSELGLDRPLHIRYGEWLAGFFTGDLGTSYGYSMPVEELLAGKAGVTACLSILAFILVILIAFPLGLFMGRYRGGKVDRALCAVNQISMSIPPFFIGIIFSGIFGLALRLFVVGDFIPMSESFRGFWGYLFFPALAIALPKSAMAAKLLRSSIIGEMDKDYVRTAFSRGNSTSEVLRRHVLRNSVMPVITFLAVILADIIAGSIIIEQIFSIPGIGRMLLLSIGGRDHPVVLCIIMMIAAVVLFVNFLADILYQYIDPRIKFK